MPVAQATWDVLNARQRRAITQIDARIEEMWRRFQALQDTKPDDLAWRDLLFLYDEAPKELARIRRRLLHYATIAQSDAQAAAAPCR